MTEPRHLPDGTVDLLMLPYISMSVLSGGLFCHYCTSIAGTRDHVVPRTRMGVDQFWNLVPACKTCNKRKGPRMPTCDCVFCRRAVRLFDSGWKRNRPREVPQPADGFVVGCVPEPEPDHRNRPDRAWEKRPTSDPSESETP